MTLLLSSVLRGHMTAVQKRGDHMYRQKLATALSLTGILLATVPGCENSQPSGMDTLDMQAAGDMAVGIDLGGTGQASCPSLQSGVDLVATTTSAATCADATAAPMTIAYAAGADNKLDLRKPSTGAGPFPTVIWIHGGGWKGGSRTDVFQAYRLVCSGYAVASIDYRLSGTAPFPAQIYDVKAAIRFLRANAKTYNLDPQRFATFGSSAGGHLAALAATSAGVADLEDMTLGNPGVSSAVSAAVVWYGPTDIGQMDSALLAQGCAPGTASHGQAGSAESDFLGCTVNTAACAPAIKRANPITYVGASTPPIFMMHGTTDCIVPNAQTTLLKQAMDAAGRCALKRNVVGAGHGGPEWTSQPAQDTLAPFFNAVLKP